MNDNAFETISFPASLPPCFDGQYSNQANMSSDHANSVLPPQAHTKPCDFLPPRLLRFNAVNETNIPDTPGPLLYGLSGVASSDAHDTRAKPKTTEPDSTDTESTCSDDEGFFPIYCPTEEDDGTLEDLSTSSPPELQTVIFIGIGLVDPVSASLDTSTRNLRREGKLVLRRLNMAREANAGEEEKKRRSCCARSTSKDKCKTEITAVVMLNEYVENVSTSLRPGAAVVGLVRPVEHGVAGFNLL